MSQLRRRRFKQRRSLKTKPEGHKRTRSQRRLLKRLSGKEARAVSWKLWNVAQGIVREAIKAGASVIVIEDLKGIRGRIRVAKKQRLIHHGWPFSSFAAAASSFVPAGSSGFAADWKRPICAYVRPPVDSSA